MSASSAEVAYFGRVCEEDITEVSVHITHSCEKETPGHDDDLLPFYHANPELVGIYKDIASSDVSEERNTTVRRYLDCISYVEGNKMIRSNTDDRRFVADNCTYHYIEDTWTKRLFEAVVSRFKHDDVEYTASYRSRSCNRAVLKRMPEGMPNDSLLFHGSPDIIIQYKPITVLDCDICCLEVKKHEDAVYLPGSMMPQQAGQILCYIHQLLVAQIIKKIIGNKHLNEATGYGLYVVRASGQCILFKMVLSERPLKISAKVYYGRDRTAVLCAALNALSVCHKT